ncbi:LysR family transcriptional regulator [Pacificibacter marinus]|uniref:LysR family transcriptional regulator n=1 Tax=Pacificibacter marinus TaxID=658057 RepID=UPI001C06BB72|nr:LysR family transcriptional regulator [Pacificibacter marinus]MBU2867321.1 LysR family transcriptional regulator [Pacificibacter marinus]
MDLKLVTTFLDIFESRNFNRTADRLDLTQSSVSGRIRALEAEVGAQLFERGRAGATPTPAGIRFEPHARLLLATWDHACRDTGASLDRDRLLRLAGQFSLMRHVLVDWVVKIRAQDPRTAVDLRADYSLQIMRDLSIGAMDIGVLYSPQYLPDLDIQQVGEEQFVMVSTDSDRMSGVAKETYVNTDYTSFFSQRHQALLPDFSNAPISVSFEGLVVEFFRRTGGSAYVPLRAVEDTKLVIDGLRLVKDAPPILHPIFTAVHNRRRHHPDVIKALAALRETLLASG